MPTIVKIRCLLWALLFGALLAFLEVNEVHAQTETPTDTPPPTGTLPWCALTSTPTSMFPTFVFPTVDYSTMTPCPPGALCPTSTAWSMPTGTAQGTATVTPTITPSCTGSGTGIKLYSVGASHSGSPYVSAGTKLITCSIPTDGTGVAQSFWCEVDYTVSDNSASINGDVWDYVNLRPTVAGQTLYYSITQFGGRCEDGSNNIIPCEGVITMGTTTQSTHLRREITTEGVGTFRNITYFEISTCPFVEPTPTPIVTGTPGLCQDGEVIDTELIDFTPPGVTPGACYTIVPDLLLEIPTIVVEASPISLPASIGVPGVELCVSYYTMGLSFMGFDAWAFLSVLMSMVCAVVIVRELRS